MKLTDAKPAHGSNFMTKQEFNNLKVGDRAFLRNKWEAYDTQTEVLSIDRIFGKVVLLTKSRPLSYRAVRIRSSRPVSSYVGTYKYKYQK